MNRKILIFIISIIFLLKLESGFPGKKKAKIKKQTYILVGVYSDKGVGEWGKEVEYARKIATILRGTDPGIKTVLINKENIQNSVLEGLEVVLFPGGSGGGQSSSLGEEGREKIRDFVKNGGGYIGICAGAYLAQSYDTGFSWQSLKIAKAKFAFNTEHWNRGAGIVRVRITGKGKKLFPELKRKKHLHIFYSHGPLLVSLSEKKKSYDELLVMESNVYHNNREAQGESPGTTSILRNRYGKGTVILSSGHPELTPGLRWMLSRMVRLAARKRWVRYPRRLIKTAHYHREIMFDTAWQQKEKRFLDIATNNGPGSNTRKRIEALYRLTAMASVDLCDHFPKLLRDPKGAIREKTARIIKSYDYFPSISNLRQALHKEKKYYVKRAYRRAIRHLETR